MMFQHFLTYDENRREYKFSRHVQTLSEYLTDKFEETLNERIQFGEEERFREEQCPGSSTAFLVGDDLVLTTSHCVTNRDNGYTLRPKDQLDRIRIVFGFFHIRKEDKDNEYIFHESDVYTIKKVIAFDYREHENTDYFVDYRVDWALIKLDRPVTGRNPLNINFRDKINEGEQVFMLGYPSGMSEKFVWNATVINGKNHDNFQADLDAFAGNSGSAIFLVKTQEVVGLLFSGNKDYSVTEDYKGTEKKRIFTVHNKKQDIKGYEWCQRTSSLTFVKLYLQMKACNTLSLENGNNKIVYKHLAEYYCYILTAGPPVYRCFSTTKYAKKAFEIFSENANDGSDFLCGLGICYASGIGVNKDEKKAIGYFEEAAMNENGYAQYRLGLHKFYYNFEVLSTKKQAVKHFKSARRNGSLEALPFLGYCYENGFGTKKNKEKAMKCYREAADKGNIEAYQHISPPKNDDCIII